MCGRFTLFNEREIREINEILQELEEKQLESIKTGEIFPTNCVPLLVSHGQEREVQTAIWGFPRFKGSGVIINARSETARIKPMFRNHLALHRCIIPSTGFYEWKKVDGMSKIKYELSLPEDPVLYMAGLYNDFANERRFVILTTEANSSVADIHDRMPLVLNRSELDFWLHDHNKALEILLNQQARPKLVRQKAA